MSLFVNFPFIWQIPVLEISGLKAMCLLHFHRYCQVASQKIIAFALPTVMFESFHFLTLSPALNIISIICLCLFGGWKLVFCFYFLEVEHLNFFSFACYVTKLFLFPYQFVGAFYIVGILTHCLSQYYKYFLPLLPRYFIQSIVYLWICLWCLFWILFSWSCHSGHWIPFPLLPAHVQGWGA